MNKMTLDEAIELLTYSDEHKTLLLTVQDYKAVRLGIEALKAWQECRDKGLVPLGWVLPGESIENNG